MEAESGEGHSHLGSLAHHPDVRPAQSQTEASPYGGTIDGSNDRDLDISEAEEHLVELLHDGTVVGRAVPVSGQQPGQVSSGTEGPAGPSDDGSSDTSLSSHLRYSSHQSRANILRQGVQLARVVQS